jgi:hypothetical protein
MAVLHPTWHLTHTDRKESGGWSLSGTGCCARQQAVFVTETATWYGQANSQIVYRKGTPRHQRSDMRPASHLLRILFGCSHVFPNCCCYWQPVIGMTIDDPWGSHILRSRAPARDTLWTGQSWNIPVACWPAIKHGQWRTSRDLMFYPFTLPSGKLT